jgi:hypothetical protein
MTNEFVHDTVTALAESDATGEVAEIFADIRQTMRIPALTSIWRILADSTADLASTWGAVKPVYATGQPEASLALLRANAEFPDLDPISMSEIERIGVSSDDLVKVKSILGSYNRSNSLNLLTQSGLVSKPTPSYIPYAELEPESVSRDLPNLLGRNEISDPVWDIVIRVNSYGTKEKNPGLATVYRHLAHWPAILELIQSRLEKAQNQGAISSGADSVTRVAIDEGARLAHLRDEDHVAQMSDTAKNTVENYVDGPFNVARIVSIGTAIARWLDKAS